MQNKIPVTLCHIHLTAPAPEVVLADTSALASRFSALADHWGISTHFEFQLHSTDKQSTFPLKVVIDNKLLICSDDLLNEVRSYATGIPLSRYHDNEYWLIQLYQNSTPLSKRIIPSLLTTLVNTRPSVLLGEQQFADFWNNLEISSEVKSHFIIGTWQQLFAELLDMKISLAPVEKIAAILNTVINGDHSLGYQSVKEELINNLAAHHIKLKINPAYFRILSLSLNQRNPIPLIRDAVFKDTGLLMPPIKLVLNDDMSGSAFQIVINNWHSHFRIGLAIDEYLISDTSSRHTPEHFFVHPYNSLMSVMIEPGNSNAKQDNPGPLDYLAFSLGGIVQQEISCLITNGLIDLYKQKIKESFPQTIATLGNSHLSTHIISGTVRSLLEQKVPVNNMLKIIELMVEADYLKGIDAKHFAVFDRRFPESSTTFEEPWKENPVHLAKYVRSHLVTEVKQARLSANWLPLILKTSKELVLLLEDLAARHQSLSLELRQQLLDNIRLSYSEANASTLAIVTYPGLALQLKKLIADVFPFIEVFTLQELTKVKIGKALPLNLKN